MLNVIALRISTEQWEFCDQRERTENGHRASPALPPAVGDGHEAHNFCLEKAQTRSREGGGECHIHSVSLSCSALRCSLP